MKKDSLKINIVVIITCILGWALLFFWGAYWYLKDRYPTDLSLKILESTLNETTLGFIIVLFISWFMLFLDKVPYEKFDKFLCLPDKNSIFTFPVLSTFLGEQAFASLVATILITFSKDMFEASNVIGVSIYVAIIMILMYSFSTMSLIRFIFYFTKYRILIFMPLSIFSWVFMFTMVYVGLKLGGG
ncbi:hypothetical protein RGL49_003387 [Vibrio parahaemolyticus]|nr:hypothetical protein [Vibrio parahaemolyticus]